MATYLMSSDSKENVLQAMVAKKWAFKGKKTSNGLAHIKPGDIIFLHIKTEGIYAVATATSEPVFGQSVTDIWSNGTYYHPFSIQPWDKKNSTSICTITDLRSIIGNDWSRTIVVNLNGTISKTTDHQDQQIIDIVCN